MSFNLQALVKQTLIAPREAAGQLMVMRRGLGFETLWSTVVLAAVLNSLVISAGMYVFPPSPEQVEIMPRLFFRPALLAVVAAGAMVVFVVVLHWAGRMLGGKGELRDMLVVITWLQIVQVGLQLAVLVLAIVAMPLASLANMAAFFWGLWILIAFVDRVHGFKSPMKSMGVLAMGITLLLFGITIFLLLFGAVAKGAAQYV